MWKYGIDLINMLICILTETVPQGEVYDCIILDKVPCENKHLLGSIQPPWNHLEMTTSSEL